MHRAVCAEKAVLAAVTTPHTGVGRTVTKSSLNVVTLATEAEPKGAWQRTRALHLNLDFVRLALLGPTSSRALTVLNFQQHPWAPCVRLGPFAGPGAIRKNRV